MPPILHFTPTAWAKLRFFCRRSETEIGGFGVSAPHDLLMIEEFVTVKQTVTMGSVVFDDEAVADFFEAQVDVSRKPDQFARLWLHTHPGESASPSLTDMETFHRVFGGCNWAVMFILARGGRTYARLHFNVGPGGGLLIPVHVDYRLPFAGSDHDAWAREYDANVQREPLVFGDHDADLFGGAGRDKGEPDELDFAGRVDELSMSAATEAEEYGESLECLGDDPSEVWP